MEIEDAPKQSESILKPLLAAIPSFVVQFQLGTLYGQSSVMLPQLQMPDSKIKIDEYASWIASILMIGSPITSILCGPLTDKSGRIAMIKVFLLLSAIGFILVGISTNVAQLLIGRFCLGVSYGFSFASYVYNTEICTPKQRTVVLALGPVWSSLGLLYMMIVGGLLPWDVTSLLTGIISILGLVCTFLVPESPAWLCHKERLDDAIMSLRWLRGNLYDVDSEIQLLKDNDGDRSGGVSTFRVFSKSTVRKPFFIILILAVLQAGCGYYILIFYSINFCQMFHAKMDAWMVSIGLAATRMIGCVVSTYAQKRTKRKVLGGFSGLSSAATLVTLLLITQMFKDKIPDEGLYPAIIAVCLILFIFFCSFGIYPLPWLMVYELYPLKVRGSMCGVSYAVTILSSFVSVKLFFFFISTLSVYGTILMFALFSLLFGLFSIFILPETHGKTLVEIEQGFRSKKCEQKNSKS